MKEDLLIIVAIVVFFVIIISLAANLWKTREGLDNPSATVITAPSSILPADVAINIENETIKLNTLLNIATNKTDYQNIIASLSDYYDNLMLLTVVNAQKSNNGYSIQQLNQYKNIKDALNEVANFVDSN